MLRNHLVNTFLRQEVFHFLHRAIFHPEVFLLLVENKQINSYYVERLYEWQYVYKIVLI